MSAPGAGARATNDSNGRCRRRHPRRAHPVINQTVVWNGTYDTSSVAHSYTLRLTDVHSGRSVCAQIVRACVCVSRRGHRYFSWSGRPNGVVRRAPRVLNTTSVSSVIVVPWFSGAANRRRYRRPYDFLLFIQPAARSIVHPSCHECRR